MFLSLFLNYLIIYMLVFGHPCRCFFLQILHVVKIDFIYSLTLSFLLFWRAFLHIKSQGNLAILSPFRELLFEMAPSVGSMGISISLRLILSRAVVLNSCPQVSSTVSFWEFPFVKIAHISGHWNWCKTPLQDEGSPVGGACGLKRFSTYLEIQNI